MYIFVGIFRKTLVFQPSLNSGFDTKGVPLSTKLKIPRGKKKFIFEKLNSF